ncbi:hypothetical protein TNCV_2698991 [Trichonephila clavipes]|nr:hypothetical protein TNCV_2698991 [Trichonephila clavipes]
MEELGFLEGPSASKPYEKERLQVCDALRCPGPHVRYSRADNVLLCSLACRPRIIDNKKSIKIRGGKPTRVPFPGRLSAGWDVPGLCSGARLKEMRSFAHRPRLKKYNLIESLLKVPRVADFKLSHRTAPSSGSLGSRIDEERSQLRDLV